MNTLRFAGIRGIDSTSDARALSQELLSRLDAEMVPRSHELEGVVLPPIETRVALFGYDPMEHERVLQMCKLLRENGIEVVCLDSVPPVIANERLSVPNFDKLVLELKRHTVDYDAPDFVRFPEKPKNEPWYRQHTGSRKGRRY